MSSNLSVDMGPMWFHGFDRHPLRPYAEKFGFTFTRTDYDNAAFYDGGVSFSYSYDDDQSSDGMMADLSSEFWRDFWPLVRREQDDSNKDADLSSTMMQIFQKVRRKKNNKLGPSSLLRRRKFLELMIQDNIVLDQAADAEDLSLWSHDADYYLDDDVEADDDRILQEGFGSLAQAIAGELNVKWLLETVVETVDYSGKKVKVTTEDGTKKRYDKVIVALPLGVLQQRRSMFKPALKKDDSLKHALNHRGAGRAEKYVLVFEEAFWPSDKTLFYSLADPGIEWLNLGVALDTQPKALVAFVCGDLSLKFEEMSDGEKENALLQALARMFPNVEMLLLETAFSSWQSDDFTLGGWSYLQVGADFKRDQKAWLEPLGKKKGNLFLAGEFASDYWGTMHGAWFSGQDAAKEAVKSTKKKSSSKKKKKKK